jgi:hypothetical protein
MQFAQKRILTKQETLVDLTPERAARAVTPASPMHHKPDNHHRKPLNGHRADRPAPAGGKPTKRNATRGQQKWAAGQDRISLFAHLCEVMGLFPRAGNLAIAEMVTKLRTERLPARRKIKTAAPDY